MAVTEREQREIEAANGSDRRPVVFVHGLMSSPEAWTNAMNDLRGNSELRKRYQFWMFFYSTGNPLLASGARFRR